MTDRVREILSWYRSENPAVRSNLGRMLNHGRPPEQSTRNMGFLGRRWPTACATWYRARSTDAALSSFPAAPRRTTRTPALKQPAPILYEKFGITAENAIAQAKALLGQ